MLNRYVILPLLGIVFIVSSALKALDWTAFAVQVSYYGLVREPSIVRALSLALIGLEFGLGCALLLRLALRSATLPGVFALLLGFSLLLVWAWIFRDLTNCGCFGKYLPMGPGESLLKNVVMMAMVGFAWWGLRRREKPERAAAPSPDDSPAPDGPPTPHSAGRLTLEASLLWRLGLSVAGALAVMAFAVVNPFSSRPAGDARGTGSTAGSDAQGGALGTGGGKFAKYSFDWQGERLDLGKGTCFVAMISDSCEHCAEIVAGLNQLSKDANIPRIIGLVLGEEDSAKNFQETFHPAFPIRLIPVLEFFDLVGDAPPRFYLVENGASAKYWDEDLPKAAAILEAVEGLKESQRGR